MQVYELLKILNEGLSSGTMSPSMEVNLYNQADGSNNILLSIDTLEERIDLNFDNDNI